MLKKLARKETNIANPIAEPAEIVRSVPTKKIARIQIKNIGKNHIMR
jgi:hypothetical protein